MRSRHQNSCCVFFALWLTAVVGCGPATDLLPVSGAVTLNGVPLDGGSIQLVSHGSQNLHSAGASIRNGEFNIPQEKGLPPGTYLVMISAPDESAPLVASRVAPGERGAPPSAPERIPAEYNINSSKTIEVAADSDNRFEFQIVGHPEKNK